MLPSTNATISIQRLGATAPQTWQTVQSGVDVYINQVREDLLGGFESQPSYTVFRMFTDGDHETITYGDRISDGTRTYEVRTPADVSSDLTGTHHQYMIILK